MIRILLVDDQTVVREGIAAIISTDPDIEVIGQAAHGEEALSLMRHLHPDLVLMDLQMPVMNGVQTTRELKKKYPQVSVLVLTTYAADEWVFDAVQAGAAGYLLKDSRRDELVSAIKGTVEGESFVDPAIAGKLLRHVAGRMGNQHAVTSGIDSLTERELDVLQLIALGLNNTAIAERLHLAPGTVRNYVSTIFEKLRVSDRTQAAVAAIKAGITSG